MLFEHTEASDKQAYALMDMHGQLILTSGAVLLLMVQAGVALASTGIALIQWVAGIVFVVDLGALIWLFMTDALVDSLDKYLPRDEPDEGFQPPSKDFPTTRPRLIVGFTGILLTAVQVLGQWVTFCSQA